VAAVCFVESMDVVAFVTSLTSSSVSVRPPPIACILATTSIAFVAPVNIVPTVWLSLHIELDWEGVVFFKADVVEVAVVILADNFAFYSCVCR
jgi:hypothetical protein